ncbi:SulP family inorganic anion transporter [Legionella sp. W05-934-2]|uniref:SulP family inorganic anion transporter n=1 Tax=Legionella sp. W05-934-2 TaxID=1198649 RepID=UPI003462B364
MISRAILKDLIAGFSVFLLALPLCLGIALASHFPPSAGIISAILGGVLTFFLGGSPLTIKGPAAGLIVIALGAVLELGHGNFQLGYERALACGFFAAIIQIIIAYNKKATFAEIMPPSVIHGMLAGIGIIIVVKQFYVLTGTHPISTSLIQLIMNAPMAIIKENPIIFAIGLIALFIAIFWSKIKYLNNIPSTIVVIITVIPLSLLYDISHEHIYRFGGTEYNLGPGYLVHLPLNFLEAIQFPDFSVVFSFSSIKYTIMFALVGSIESLLTVCAVDTLSKVKKPSDLNKDLMSVGVGNLACTLLGGLPMIAEIVRSKANIDYGAQSNKANLFHGIFMLIAVLALAPVINLIPLSALAALLIFVGFKLASPRTFIHVYRIGLDQIVLFSTTLIITLVEDLLTGVIAGLILKLIFHKLRGYKFKDLFNPFISVSIQEDRAFVTVNGPLTFVAYTKLKNLIMHELDEHHTVILNLAKTHFIDHTLVQKLNDLEHEIGASLFIVLGKEHLQPIYNHDLAARKAK